MRKFLLALLGSTALAGLAAAGEVTLVKYDKDKKELTVKEDGGDKIYKVTEKTKYSFAFQDGKETTSTATVAEKLLASDKAAGKAKLDITTDNNTVTAVKIKSTKKKN